ncbi:DUF6082 family protein [Streptomyces longispororuber]|uniref:DUF6082 family protein n=1 Tax=Streptomyces longispororuber TaxID=68230 RepID=UPI00210DF0EF|nr:DUF6082 family protein [Streptomyces longispororuber]MCQ4211848.1 DUF6082 family protein [Streptomyces longispororuber]
MATSKLLRWTPWAAVTAVLLALTILTPFILNRWAPGGLKWDRLADISQTYSALSAPLSGAALIAVAWSLIMQARQMRIANGNEFRAGHRELMMQALQDPSLQECWEPPVIPTTRERARQYTYVNLIISGWRVDYLNGASTDASVLVWAQTLMRGEIGREFWRTRRAGWHATASALSRKDRTFVTLLDRALESSDRAGPPTPVSEYYLPGSGGGTPQ